MAVSYPLITQPFALAGDTTTIPTTAQPDGSVSFNQGWPVNYQQDPATVPTAKVIDRGTMNYLFNVITRTVQQYQREGVPEFIAAADNGGVAVAYPIGVSVKWRNLGTDPWRVYINTVNNNTAAPPAASWLDVTNVMAGAVQRSGDTMTGVLGLLTAAQFLNDTKAASTAFVQRALGNAQSGVALTTTTAIPASAAGNVYVLDGAGVYTLPQLSALPQGASFSFQASVSGVTLNAFAGDVIWLGSAPGVSSISLNIGDTIRVARVTSIWSVLGGTVAARTSSDFSRLLTGSGQAVIAGGLILKWGTASVITTQTITLPTAFPNQCFSAMGCGQTAADSDVAGSAWFEFGILSRTQIFAKCVRASPSGNVAASRGVGWFAIGY